MFPLKSSQVAAGLGAISTYAGLSTCTSQSTNGQAATSCLNSPQNDVAFDSHGNMFIPDFASDIIRMVRLC